MLDLLMAGRPGDPAIGAPGRASLTYAELQELATDTVRRLNALGVGRNDRVAIVLPNGPEMAAAFNRGGEALGITFPIDVERRIEGAAACGAHKTSMLQDLELSRPLEVYALVTSVQELEDLTGIAAPSIDILLALLRQGADLVHSRGQVARG